MLNTDSLLMIVASLLLLVVNWLAFHDFRSAHRAGLVNVTRFGPGVYSIHQRILESKFRTPLSP
jgi:hypothetical protein